MAYGARVARMHPWVPIFLACVAALSVPAAAASPEIGAQPQVQALDQRGEAALRDLISGIMRGKPNYGLMSTDLADQVARHLAPLQAAFVSLGNVLFIRSLGVDAQGMDVYQVRQLRGLTRFAILMAPDGQVSRLRVRGEMFSTPTMPIPRGREAGVDPDAVY